MIWAGSVENDPTATSAVPFECASLSRCDAMGLGERNEAAGIHYRYRRCSGLAARSACAAGENAANWHPIWMVGKQSFSKALSLQIDTAASRVGLDRR
jgi:hypothetical protein